LIWLCWLIIYSSSEISKGENDGGGSVGGDDVYSSKEEEPVLASLSNSYSELEVISVDCSGLSSCPILHHLLTTYTTDYCSKKNLYDFGLRRPFYSKQDLINTCCPPI